MAGADLVIATHDLHPHHRDLSTRDEAGRWWASLGHDADGGSQREAFWRAWAELQYSHPAAEYGHHCFMFEYLPARRAHAHSTTGRGGHRGRRERDGMPAARSGARIVLHGGRNLAVQGRPELSGQALGAVAAACGWEMARCLGSVRSVAAARALTSRLPKSCEGRHSWAIARVGDDTEHVMTARHVVPAHWSLRLAKSRLAQA